MYSVNNCYVWKSIAAAIVNKQGSVSRSDLFNVIVWK